MINDIYFKTQVKDEIFEEIKKESKEIGYYDLPLKDTSNIKAFAKTIKKKNIAVLGIGGSSLGAFCIYKFLKHKNKSLKKLSFLDTTDPILLESKLNEIDLKDTFFFVISKSGNTIETISILKYILSKIKISKENCSVITDEGSNLEKFAKANDLNTFYVPSNVGGRFSVFSEVGLLPLASSGIDIELLLKGAKYIRTSFFDKGEFYKKLISKAYKYGSFANDININVVFSYSETLRAFNAWYIQLWAESLGKTKNNLEKVGLTPVGIVGPLDQHSFLQLISEGKEDKSLTFISIENFENELSIPNISLKGLENMDFLNEVKFCDLINLQAESTLKSLKDTNISLDLIKLKEVSELSIGKLLYYFELLTSITAKVLKINAYDQPGVEKGKLILKRKLKENCE